MWTRPRSTWGALVVLLIVPGCGGAEPVGLPSQPTVAGVELVRPAARLPTTVGAPEQLRAGRYRAPEGFAPGLSLTVPAGWWGGGSAGGWAVGQGYDAATRRYGGAGIFVQVLDLSFAQAVRAFRRVEGLAGSHEPRLHRVAGRRAATFRTRAASTPVLLRAALGVDVDVRAEAWSQTFVELPGARTLFVRTEVSDPAVVPVLVRVLGSLSLE